MKKKTFVSSCLALVCFAAQSQISILDTDLMNAGDTFRVSIASPQQYQTSVLTPTGAAHTWDFSNLIPLSQDIDTFYSVLTANPLYLLTYGNVGFNANKANIVTLSSGTFPLPLPITLENPATFYYKNATNFRSPGTGVELGGVATPLPYATAKDTIYHLPLTFGDGDSVKVNADLSIPGLGSYSTSQKRVWTVDGWGTLITPYGTHDVLRYKAVLTGKDSLADTTGFGFAIPRPETVVYRWLGKSEGIPLLEITTTKNFNLVSITSVRYRDNMVPVLSSVAEVENMRNVQVYPNPFGGDYLAIKCQLAHRADITISVYAVGGTFINKSTTHADEMTDQLIIHRFDKKLAPGTYIVKVKSGNEEHTLSVVAE